MHGEHLTGLFIQTGVKILLQCHFFKARGFQPLLSPFIGNLACQDFKSVLWLKYPKTLGPGRGNGHKEREAGWCSAKPYWFSVSTVTPVLGGTGMKDKKRHPLPSIQAPCFLPDSSEGLGGIADSSAGQSGI